MSTTILVWTLWVVVGGPVNGGYHVCPGDWVITTEDGDRYLCKPAIFEKTYAPAPQGSSTAVTPKDST